MKAFEDSRVRVYRRPSVSNSKTLPDASVGQRLETYFSTGRFWRRKRLAFEGVVFRRSQIVNIWEASSQFVSLPPTRDRVRFFIGSSFSIFVITVVAVCLKDRQKKGLQGSTHRPEFYKNRLHQKTKAPNEAKGFVCVLNER